MNRIVFLTIALILPLRLLAQNPKLAPDDLDFTRDVAKGNHLIAQVTLRMEENEYVRFRYDRYPDVKRITTEDGVEYAQPKGKDWMKSDDWGKTGAPIKLDKADELDMFASVAESPLGQAVARDKSQGETVWKLVAQEKRDDCALFTYERSREKPRPDGVYPKYTFIKNKNDTDGRLLLEHFSAQMRSGEKLIPVEIAFDFMILLPPGSVKIERVPVSGKPEAKCQ